MITDLIDWIKNYTLTPHSSIVGIGVTVIVFMSAVAVFYTPKDDQQAPPL